MNEWWKGNGTVKLSRQTLRDRVSSLVPLRIEMSAIKNRNLIARGNDQREREARRAHRNVSSMRESMNSLHVCVYEWPDSRGLPYPRSKKRMKAESKGLRNRRIAVVLPSIGNGGGGGGGLEGRRALSVQSVCRVTIVEKRSLLRGEKRENRLVAWGGGSVTRRGGTSSSPRRDD